MSGLDLEQVMLVTGGSRHPRVGYNSWLVERVSVVLPSVYEKRDQGTEQYGRRPRCGKTSFAIEHCSRKNRSAAPGAPRVQPCKKKTVSVGYVHSRGRQAQRSVDAASWINWII